MGLASSREPRDIKVVAADVGIVRITEDAIGNIEKTIRQQQQEQLEEKAIQPKQHETRHVTFKNDNESKKRLDEYESRLITSFEKASQDVDEMFKRRYQSTPICQSLQQQVYECYKQNPQQTLNCIEVVNKYIKCVEDERLKVSSNGA
jgi:hypothetical protein